jgi:hypothetical protein
MFFEDYMPTVCLLGKPTSNIAAQRQPLPLHSYRIAGMIIVSVLCQRIDVSSRTKLENLLTQAAIK